MQCPTAQVPPTRVCCKERKAHTENVLKVDDVSYWKIAGSPSQPQELYDFTIVNCDFAALLGLQTAQLMNLLFVETKKHLDCQRKPFTPRWKDIKLHERDSEGRFSDVFGEEFVRL